MNVGEMWRNAAGRAIAREVKRYSTGESQRSTMETDYPTRTRDAAPVPPEAQTTVYNVTMPLGDQMSDYERGVRDMAMAAQEVVDWFDGQMKTKAVEQLENQAVRLVRRSQ